jgi:murein endopeptidase
VTRLRSLLFLVPLLVTEGSFATAGEPLGPVEVAPPTVVVVPAPLLGDWAAEVPAAMGPSLPPEEEEDLEAHRAVVGPPHEVHWTVLQDEPRDLLASRWGLMERTLVALNPELRGLEEVPAGLQLRVFERDEAWPTRSIGAPNKGRLQHGLPMPEGKHWELRDRRTRAYGATNAIGAMVTAFTRYGEQLGGAAPPVSVGEISGPRGGRAHPHSSHRSGRDVDIGYVLLPGTEGEQWKRANPENFDAEKNWVLIKALVETGEVQTIFISRKLQRMLEPVARQDIGEEALGRYFWRPGGGPEQDPILRHWDGHRDHMHVRFRCEPGNDRCRSRSTSPGH